MSKCEKKILVSNTLQTNKTRFFFSLVNLVRNYILFFLINLLIENYKFKSALLTYSDRDRYRLRGTLGMKARTKRDRTFFLF